MAAPDTSQHTTDVIQEEPHLANTVITSENIDCNVGERGVTPKHTEDGEEQSTNISRDSEKENKQEESGVTQNVDSEEASYPDVSRCEEDSSCSPQSDDRSRGTLEDDQQIPEKASKEVLPPALGQTQGDQVDGPCEETPTVDDVTTREDGEDIVPTTQETPQPADPVAGVTEKMLLVPEASYPYVSRCEEDSGYSPQSDERSRGTLEDDQQIPEKASKEASPPAVGRTQGDQVDRPHEEREDDDGVSLDHQESLGEDVLGDIEDIGPITQETLQLADPVAGGPGYLKYMGLLVAVVVAILVHQHLPAETPPQKEDVRQIDIFLRRLETLKSQFPNQRPEVWRRSKIHLLKHLQTAQPSEPVSLILTAGVRAERTMSCLARGLASTFSAAFNASVLHIDGASKTHQDSDQVKRDIDSELQVAFEGDKPVAIIHRFEELPPASTLIFYRYCDHENAAYKKTFLIFTVLLSDEEEIPADSRLIAVEEMVDDQLQKKFLTDSHPVSFDRMDRDKYGGLWSRISHLILPVTAESRTEQFGCSTA